MNPRSLLLPLLLALSFSAIAQTSQREVSASLGLWDSDELESGPVAGVSYNRFWAGPFSTRVGGLLARSDDATTGVVHLSGELHLLRASRVSPWIGAGAAFVYSRIAPPNEHFSGSETDFGAIFSGGVDVAVSPRLAVGAEVSYLSYDVTIGSRSGIAADPLMLMSVARYRF